MGSLSKLFLDFHDENSLTKTYKEKITKGRDALRNKIGNKFEEKGRKKPQHCTQGSYAMKTAIMPLDGDEFDLDNGVYLRGYSTDQDDWPAAQTVHTWVKEAVEKHTSNSPINRRWHETNGVINYIGEWHTHPNMQAVPSSTDISSLKEITEKVKGVLPGTILIIAGKENQTNLILQKDNAIWIQSLLKEKEEGE